MINLYTILAIASQSKSKQCSISNSNLTEQRLITRKNIISFQINKGLLYGWGHEAQSGNNDNKLRIITKIHF